MFGCTIFLDNVQLELEWDDDLEWFTRMSDLPFRVWDVLQEVVNNDYLPEGCEVGRGVNPHSFRLKAITNWILDGLNEQEVKHRAGWSYVNAQYKC